MKTPPPDRSTVVKELEKRLLQKWKEEDPTIQPTDTKKPGSKNSKGTRSITGR